MRRAYLLWLHSAMRAVAQFSYSDACHFIGSRFARRPSICEAGFCSNISRTPSGVFVPQADAFGNITCADAQAVTTEFLDERASRSEPLRIRPVTRGRTGAIVNLDLYVVPLLERLAFGNRVDESELLPILSYVDKRFMDQAAHEIANWRGVMAPVILASAPISRMGHRYEHIIRTADLRALTFASLRASLQMAIHFYFDLAALLGAHFVAEGFVDDALGGICGSGARYRESEPQDGFLPFPWIGVPSESGDLVRTSLAISKSVLPDAQLTLEELQLLFMLISGWEVSERSSTKALLNEQMYRSVCGQLGAVTASIVSLPSFLTIRVLAGLLVGCRGVLPMSARRYERDYLAYLASDAAGSILIDPNKSAAVFFRDETFPWSLGLRMGQGMSAEMASARAGELLRAFLASQVMFSDKGENYTTFVIPDRTTARAFGRALGLSILHEVDLEWLSLEPAVVDFLHPRPRYTAANFTSISAAIAPTSIDALLYTSAGIEDVLGMGGVEMFSSVEWMAAFGLVL